MKTKGTKNAELRQGAAAGLTNNSVKCLHRTAAEKKGGDGPSHSANRGFAGSPASAEIAGDASSKGGSAIIAEATSSSLGAGTAARKFKTKKSKGHGGASNGKMKAWPAANDANGAAVAVSGAGAAAVTVRDGASNWRALLAVKRSSAPVLVSGAAPKASLARAELAEAAATAAAGTVSQEPPHAAMPGTGKKRKRATELSEAAERAAAGKAEQRQQRREQRRHPGDPATAAAAAIDALSPDEKTRYVALDCEMVGVGPDGKRSALAQCCLVDWDGRTIYNRYVRPELRVTDFRTFVSGVKARHLKDGSAVSLAECQREVAALLKGKILVGHALSNDLKALLLSHPRSAIRDTATYRPYRQAHGKGGGKLRPRALRKLAAEYLGITIQSGEHDPAEDARAALRLYQLKRKDWEAGLRAERIVPRHVNQALPGGDRPGEGAMAAAAPAAMNPNGAKRRKVR
ncbi:unnamed protein product [Phaeothamnion confervicola]